MRICVPGRCSYICLYVPANMGLHACAHISHDVNKYDKCPPELVGTCSLQTLTICLPCAATNFTLKGHQMSHSRSPYESQDKSQLQIKVKIKGHNKNIILFSPK